MFGDSLTAQNQDGWSGEECLQDVGYWTWAMYLLGQPPELTVLSNAGHSGDKTGDLLARVGSAVLAYRPKWVVVLGGTNDLSTIAPATIEANLATIYQRVLGTGGKVIACTITPRTGMSPTMKTAFDAVNPWIRAYAAAYPGKMVLADTYNSFVDPGGDGYAPLAAAVHDGLHPNAYGALLMGRTIQAALTGLVAPYAWVGNDASLGLVNPTMTGISGTRYNAQVTGQVATSWTVYCGDVGCGTTVVCSKVARTDGVSGEWQQMVTTSSSGFTGSGCNLQQSIANGVGMVAGDRVQLYVEVQTDDDWAGAKSLISNIHLYGSSFVEDLMYHPLWENLTLNPGAGVLRSRPMTLPAGTTTKGLTPIAWKATATGGSGTIRIGRVELRRV